MGKSDIVIRDNCLRPFPRISRSKSAVSAYVFVCVVAVVIVDIEIDTERRLRLIQVSPILFVVIVYPQDRKTGITEVAVGFEHMH